ncbi:unnamed protein product [Gongylonema pulchrum]|uniref:ShKT domain-containing protein n=1 Tax=Gongylonema pulchrum TaxID=637853 RepID=A0A183E6K1_9BILA|nr:unnamed protein product [Gongylonema pulchrum]
MQFRFLPVLIFVLVISLIEVAAQKRPRMVSPPMEQQRKQPQAPPKGQRYPLRKNDCGNTMPEQVCKNRKRNCEDIKLWGMPQTKLGVQALIEECGAYCGLCVR